MQIFFALTLFVSATLLFLLQPMFAKMVLPRLGGTPAVWNTCMVFYQAVLLAGYVYAHVSTLRLGARRQALFHLAVLGLPWLVLPIGVAGTWTPAGDANPVPWLLLLLTASVGLPFFVVSASGPMFQAWFADTGHPAAKDPYFLYAASNLGSMLALLGYPLLVEPYLTLAQQAWCWTCGYALLVVLSACCAVLLWRSPRPGTVGTASADSLGREETADVGPTAAARLRWLVLSLVPSSLLLGVTTHISSDIAAVPLLWVVPLVLYLLTFVLVFARRAILPHAWMLRAQPYLLVLLAALFFHGATKTVWLMLALHLAAFFVTAMVCHGELARSRPHARHLTQFYLYMSLGGVLGGLLNALVAPQLFPVVLEYPLMLVVACALRPAQAGASRLSRNPLSLWERAGVRACGCAKEGQHRWIVFPSPPTPLPQGERGGSGTGASPQGFRWLDLLLPAAVAAALSAAVLAVEAAGGALTMAAADVILGLAALAAFAWHSRPLRFALAVAGVLVVGVVCFGRNERLLHVERNFFGVVRVQYDPKFNALAMVHGSTNHGMQSLDPKLRHEPLAYFHPHGPLGDVFREVCSRAGVRRIGIIGLGTGSISSYARPGQQVTFYEIDPAVERIARDPRYFTYLRDCKAPVSVVLGDARLTLAGAPDRRYDLFILDAFNSDAIPVHLVTREALRLYLDKLSDDGVLVMHVSNRYLNLEPVLEKLAEDAGVTCRICNDTKQTAADTREGKIGSRWVVMARRPQTLALLLRNPRWKPLVRRPGAPLWTDDFSNILSVLKWW